VTGLLFRFAFRGFLQKPVRLVLLSAFLFFDVGLMGAKGSFSSEFSHFYVWVLGAGIIGSDLSSGVLQQLFARPVKRWQYVLARWAALWAVTLGTVFISYLIVSIYFMAHHVSYPALSLARSFLESMLVCGGTSALMTALSTLLPGNGDAALLVTYWFVQEFLSVFGLYDWARVMRTGYNFVNPTDNIIVNFSKWVPLGENLLATACSTFILLTLAGYVMNRKQLSYAD
jgi:ABC-type transport system involved in multi-copper enzyme maturation permease subunit